MGLGLDVDVVGSDQFKELQAQLQESRNKAEKQTKREETLQSEMEVCFKAMYPKLQMRDIAITHPKY